MIHNRLLRWFYIKTKRCIYCDATGYINKHRCIYCDGTGHRVEKE